MINLFNDKKNSRITGIGIGFDGEKMYQAGSFGTDSHAKGVVTQSKANLNTRSGYNKAVGSLVNAGYSKQGARSLVKNIKKNR